MYPSVRMRSAPAKTRGRSTSSLVTGEQNQLCSTGLEIIQSGQNLGGVRGQPVVGIHKPDILPLRRPQDAVPVGEYPGCSPSRGAAIPRRYRPGPGRILRDTPWDAPSFGATSRDFGHYNTEGREGKGRTFRKFSFPGRDDKKSRCNAKVVKRW